MNNFETILIMIALTMLFIEVLLTVWLGVYMVRTTGEIYLLNRRVQELQDSLSGVKHGS